MNIPAINLTDFYKTDHRRQYPIGTELVYSNLTARASRLEGVNHIVVFGIQYLLQEYLIDHFNQTFFFGEKDVVVAQYKRRLDAALGKNTISMEHIAALHDLQYLPVKIKALPEGTLCPIGIPFLTIVNTDPRFYWVTNFLETLICNVLWHPITSATIAFEYRKLLTHYAAATSDIPDFVKWQGHDFSMRGQSSVESSCVSGGAHLLSFYGTDTIPAIDWLEQYYHANSDVELIGGSVPATEHSVMCLGSKESELETYRRLLTDVYPKGIVSIVSDTWDYWKVLDETLPALKDIIMARDGKLVVRPDSGDPVKIICGNTDASAHTAAYFGTMELLWDHFGGTINSKGYRQLDPHISVIYGDSITLARCAEISKLLMTQGFASTNMVYGIGSYTYQYVTRDTFSFAMKATAGVVNGQLIEIFKDPVTDNGIKKSAKGLLCVNHDLTLTQQCTFQQETDGMLLTVFEDGMIANPDSLQMIRQRLESRLL